MRTALGPDRVVVVAAHLAGGAIVRGERVPGQRRKVRREQALLDGGGQRQLLLGLLARQRLAQPPGVLERHRRLRCKRRPELRTSLVEGTSAGSRPDGGKSPHCRRANREHEPRVLRPQHGSQRAVRQLRDRSPLPNVVEARFEGLDVVDHDPAATENGRVSRHPRGNRVTPDRPPAREREAQHLRDFVRLLGRGKTADEIEQRAQFLDLLSQLAGQPLCLRVRAGIRDRAGPHAEQRLEKRRLVFEPARRRRPEREDADGLVGRTNRQRGDESGGVRPRLVEHLSGGERAGAAREGDAHTPLFVLHRDAGAGDQQPPHGGS